MRHQVLSRWAITAAALLAAPAAAQLAPVALTPGNTLLTIASQGRALRAADLAVFTAGVTTQAATAAAALADNSRTMSQVIAGLKGAGIAERDIQTSSLSINPIYSQPDRQPRLPGQPNLPLEQQTPRIVGYRTSNVVTVRQRDLKNYSSVIDTLTAAGANQVNGPMFQLDNPEPALNEARLDALQNARARAELYAGASGLRIMRILSISEGGGFYNPQPIIVAAERGAVAAVPAPPPPAPVQAGELQQSASVTVLYELAPR